MSTPGTVIRRRIRYAGVTLATAGITIGLIPAPATADPAIPALRWGPCPAGTPMPGDAAAPERYECATAEVPLSYRDPHGKRIRIAVGRLPATDQAGKLGTIFYNPGGPGNPGRIPPVLTPALHRRFDIVGFDPRGVAASTGLRCITSPEQAEPLRRVLGQFPVNRQQERRQIADTAAITELCRDNAGPLIDHMSTANVARDLDLLRAAVGERRLSYFGHSYGTHLGTVYANLFPGRVRAIALDAVDDPVAWTTGDSPAPMSYRMGGHLGARDALHSFLRACAGQPRCTFAAPGENTADLRAKFDRILDRLHAQPVIITDPDTGQRTRVRYQDAIGRTNAMLEDAANSPALAGFLRALHTAVPAPPAPRTTPELDDYNAPLQGGAVLCADSTNPADPRAWWPWARIADREAHGFGPLSVYKTLPCAGWPGRDRDRYTGPWNRRTATPILTIGNRQGDPATPYQGTVRTTRLLGDARLLTLDTFGHGARGRSACVDAALDRYFTELELPAEGTVCRPDHRPFEK